MQEKPPKQRQQKQQRFGNLDYMPPAAGQVDPQYQKMVADVSLLSPATRASAAGRHCPHSLAHACAVAAAQIEAMQQRQGWLAGRGGECAG
jgi:hypothetical protein